MSVKEKFTEEDNNRLQDLYKQRIKYEKLIEKERQNMSDGTRLARYICIETDLEDTIKELIKKRNRSMGG